MDPDIARILNKKLGPEFISQRPGPAGGPKLTYAEGWRIINLANDVFGFNGWSSSVVSLTTDFIDENQEAKRYTVGVTAIVRVTLKDGSFHEDIGYGMVENARSKGTALDKCKKEAVTDGLKRALRSFGNLLGNCLYDKHYTQEVTKLKVPAPRFDKSELYRRPDLQEPPTTDVKPLSSLPRHIKQERSSTNTTPNVRPPLIGGLNTPVTPLLQKPPQRPQPPPPAPVAAPAPSDLAADDSFAFNSEDDAFFAGVDLTECDLGQPIHFDEDRRPPGDVNIAPTIVNSTENSNVAQRPPVTIAPSVASSNQGRPRQDHRIPVSDPNAAPSTITNANPNKRPLTPSMGGFHFPPGMANPPEQQKPQQMSVPDSGIAKKRTVDMMNSGGAGTGTSMGMGMGLSRHIREGVRRALAQRDVNGSGMIPPQHRQQQLQQPQTRREPFGALEIGQGGDVKRVRR